MGEKLYLAGNWSQPGAAPPVKQPTGVTTKTMLQLAPVATNGLYIVEWGISFDSAAAATPVSVGLFGTTVAATMPVALAAPDVNRWNSPLSNETIPLQYGVALSGYATAAVVTEGVVANYRALDPQLLSPTAPYVKQFPLGREPEVALGTFIRVRVTAAATVNVLCYVIFGAR